jgi:lysophospholipase L1-like esterase
MAEDLHKRFTVKIDSIKVYNDKSLVAFSQGDVKTAILIIELTENDKALDLTGKKVRAAFRKADGKNVMQDQTTGVSITDAIGGKVQVVLSTQVLAAKGNVRGQLSITDEAAGLVAETVEFGFTVRESLLNSSIVSLNELPIVEKMIDAADVLGEVDLETIVGNTENVNSLKSEVETARGTAGNLSGRFSSIESSVAQKANKTDLENLIDGSPKGTYATLSALQTAFPTGTTGIYVVTADGKWYYWAGSAWTEGGVYQSTGLATETQKEINNVADISDYLIGDRTSSSLKKEVKINLGDWTLDGATVANEAVGVLYIRPTSGAYGGVYTNGKKLKFTINPTPSNSPFVLLGVGATTFTAIGVHSGVQKRILEITKGAASGAYTQLLAADTGITGAGLGDEVTVELVDNLVIVNIKRSGQSSFVELFRVDLSLYAGATGWITSPKLGFVTSATTYNRVGENVYNINDLSLLSIANNVTEALVAHESQIQTLETQINNLDPSAGRWVGKTVNILGDSFTQRNLYPPVVQNMLSLATINNYGSSGNCITYKASVSTNPMSVRYTSMSNTADLVIVEGGVNDYGNGSFGSQGGVPIGTNADTTNTTFKGALKVLIEGLLTKYPTQKIAFVAPCQMNEANASLGYKNGKKANATGHYLLEYVDAMIEICALYGIPCLDMYRKLGVSELNMVGWTLDGLHLNQLGSEYYGQKLAEWLKGI